MDAGNVGYGAGGGLLSAVLTYLGFKQRLDRADSDIAALKKDVVDAFKDLKGSVVFKDTCGVCHSATLRALDGIDKKLDTLIEKEKKP